MVRLLATRLARHVTLDPSLVYTKQLATEQTERHQARPRLIDS